MATHSSVLAWRIPWTEESGGLPSMGSHSRTGLKRLSSSRTVACQAPLSMGFSRQEHWSGLPFPSPGVFLTQGLNQSLLHSRQVLYHRSTREAHFYLYEHPCNSKLPYLVSVIVFNITWRCVTLYWMSFSSVRILIPQGEGLYSVHLCIPSIGSRELQQCR